jgi:hypothetical protein
VKLFFKIFTQLSALVLIHLIPIAQPKTIKWINGNWFNGTTFMAHTFFSEKGLLTEQAPSVIDTIIDLKGMYLIPPFGEAHNHAPESEADINIFIERYLADGIFYIKNPNSIPPLTNKIRDKINHPKSVDVVFANGGLTSTGGHPVTLYHYLKTTKYNEALGKFAGINMEGNAYYTIDSEIDLEKKWPQIIADSPAFIKTYLLYSEEFEKRKQDPTYEGKRGLNPKLISAIVKKAKSCGLSVTCHVETPYDLTTALRSGVSEINHMPGYQIRWEDGYKGSYYLLDKKTLRLMKKSNAHADLTYSLAETELNIKDSLRITEQWMIQKENIRNLKRNNIPVTIGCDSYNKTARREMEYLIKMNIYTTLELIKMWCENTPKAIFPKRNITSLKEGYEASFLVLNQNPLTDPAALFNIQLRVKQGVILW